MQKGKVYSLLFEGLFNESERKTSRGVGKLPVCPKYGHGDPYLHLSFFIFLPFLYVYAARYSQRCGYGGEHGDNDLQDEFP